MNYCKTFSELFDKYPDLDNPKEAGVEFYEYTEPDEGGNDLIVVTSLEFNPGDRWWSGCDEDEDVVKEKIAKGYISVNFPYHARYIDFESVEDIDKHLTENNGKFKLPGYNYE